jgi:hypothetical protein
MTRYLISFRDGAMTFPEEELPDVAKAAHEVVRMPARTGAPSTGGNGQLFDTEGSHRRSPDSGMTECGRYCIP